MKGLRRTIPAPRLLPLTILAMMVLLISRSGVIVMAATNTERSAVSEAAAAQPPPSSSKSAEPEPHRESALGAVETRLNARFAELQQLQAKLEDLEKQRQARDESNWQGLVKVYEAMKPRDAATIFDDLDIKVMLGVLDRMKEARAAPIFAAMQPDRARLATVELQRLRASRNSLKPDAGPPSKAASGG